ncbi:MAG: hypothetical protein VW455_10945 [Nitrospinota bacterium]
MIEQYLQIALEFLKEIWFQLDSKFGLEETEAFKFIKPYLLQLQDNPTYMGIAFAVLILVPYTFYKIRSNARERDRKLEELMEEMEDEEEEEYDEDDPRRLRRPEPADGDQPIAMVDDDDDEEDKPLFEKEDEDAPPYMQILEKLDEEEKDDELHVDTQKVMGSDDEEFELEPISSELAEEPDINKDLSEFEGFDFDSEEDLEEDKSHDQAIEELQKEGELMELDADLSPDDPFSNYSELDDEEQDRAIQELQDEMESTINKLTEQLESGPETAPSNIKDLGDISIGDDATIDEEFSLDEEVLPDENVPVDQIIDEPVPEPEPISLESLEITEEPVIENIEPEKPTSLEPTPLEPTPLEPIPERDYSFDSKSDQADSLINRLKYFQENLDSRLHHGERGDLTPPPEPKINDLVSDPRFVEQRNYASKSPKVTPEDNKKYLEVLESFIFLKDQNKH